MGRAILFVIGPLSYGALGVLLMVIPVQFDSNQLEVNPNTATQIVPSGIPGLGISETPSTIAGQFDLFNDSYVEYWRGRHFIVGKEWGGMLSALLTSGKAFTYGVNTWCSCVGILLVGAMLYNLVPIPPFNGGHLILLMLEGLGIRLARVVINWVFAFGLIVSIVLFILVSITDVRWFAAHFHELI